jgi:hypothetical protein
MKTNWPTLNNEQEILALYALLRQQTTLSPDLGIFYRKIEQYIYANCTIEDLENLS